jgi:hypothetical protein
VRQFNLKIQSEKPDVGEVDAVAGVKFLKL